MVRMNEIQKKIYEDSITTAMIMGLCAGGCDWLNTDEETGEKKCLSNVGCMYR